MSVYFIEYPIRKPNLIEIKLESDHCFSEFQRYLILSKTEIRKEAAHLNNGRDGVHSSQILHNTFS